MKRKSCILPLFAMACVIMLSLCDENDDPNSNKGKGQETETHHFVFVANVDQSLFVTTLKGFEDGLQSNFEDALTLPYEVCSYSKRADSSSAGVMGAYKVISLNR